MVIAGALVLSMFAVGGCGKKVTLLPGQTAGYLHDFFSLDIGTFDIQADTTGYGYGMARAMFNTLVRYKADSLDLEPELLAEMPTVDATNTVYHFKLRPDIKVHDGSILKSSDVKFTIERMLDPNGKGQSGWLFEPIKGATAIENSEATALAGFNTISDTEFEITLEKPYAPFVQNLAVPSASIIPEAACKAAGDGWAQHPVGTGPFMLDKYEPNVLISVKKNPNYFEAGLPKLPGVDWVIIGDAATAMLDFEAGSLDVIGVSGTDLAHIKSVTTSDGQPKFKIVANPPLNTYYLMFNMNEPVFKDVRVRKAIAMSIDKQALVDSNVVNGEGFPATSFVTPGIPGSFAKGAGPAYGYDPEGAKALLAEAGATNLKLTIWQRGGDAAAPGDVAIQGFLQAVGIQCDIQIIDHAVFGQQRSKGLVPFVYNVWWADIADPDNYLYTFFDKNAAMSSNYKNPRVQALLDQARSETDPATRAGLYQQIETIIIHDDVAIVPLFTWESYMATQSSISNIVLLPSAINTYMTTEKAAGAK